MHYKLLLPIPGFKEGTIFSIDERYYLPAKNSDGNTVAGSSYIEMYPDFFQPIEESIEELKEPTTVFDLKPGNKCFMVTFYSGKPIATRTPWSETLNVNRIANEIFLTQEECEREILRRESRAKCTFRPKEGEVYFISDEDGNSEEFQWKDINYYSMALHNWNIHRTEEEAKEWGVKYGMPAFFNN